jgi:hypothetical protein
MLLNPISPSPDRQSTDPESTTAAAATALDGSALESVAVFCGSCSCGCPELFLDPAADESRRVVLTDDFGQRVQMSLEQLGAMVADIKSGVVDGALGRYAP